MSLSPFLNPAPNSAARHHAGWQPEIAAALTALLDEQAAAPVPGYAVFDWDNTCIHGDVGDAVFYGAVARNAYPLADDRLWDMLTEADERAQLLAAIEGIRTASPAEAHTAVIRFRWQFVRSFKRLIRRLDDLAYGWQTMLLAGLTPADVESLTRAVLDEALAAPLAKGYWPAPNGRGEPESVQQGIRPYPAVKALYDGLAACGITPWIVSATAEPVIRAAAAYFGYAPERVTATRLHIEHGRYTSRLDEPLVWHEGKVEAIRRFIHPTERPRLVIGDGLTDRNMLDYGADIRIVIDRNLPGLREQVMAGQQRGERWFLQPPFPVA